MMQPPRCQTELSKTRSRHVAFALRAGIGEKPKMERWSPRSGHKKSFHSVDSNRNTRSEPQNWHRNHSTQPKHFASKSHIRSKTL